MILYKLNQSYFLLPKDKDLYLFNHDTHLLEKEYYFIVHEKAVSLVNSLFEKTFDFKSVTGDHDVTQEYALSILKTLEKHGVLTIKSVPEDIKSLFYASSRDNADIEKLYLESIDHPLSASSNSNYRDLYDPDLKLS